MTTLLEQAKAVKSNRRSPVKINKEELELVVAWVNDDISITQACKVLNRTTGSFNAFALYILRNGIRAGLVNILFK